MSGSLNRVTLIGNLGADPEVRQTQDGRRIVSLSIATTETWKDDRGDKQSRTEWHRVVIFNDGLGRIAEKYLAQGAKVLVEGQLRTSKWQDQQGNDRYTTQIVLSAYSGLLTFLDSKRNGGGPAGERGAPRGGGGWDAPKGGDLDDEIPFVGGEELYIGSRACKPVC